MAGMGSAGRGSGAEDSRTSTRGGERDPQARDVPAAFCGEMQYAPGTGSAGLFRRSNPPSTKTLTLRTSTPSLGSGTTSRSVGRGRSESDEVTRVVRCCGSDVALPQSLTR